MLKEKTIKYLECDVCKKTFPNEQFNVVTFTTHSGERCYDLCDECVKAWEDILKQPVAEKSQEFKVKLADFSIENRRKMIKDNQSPSKKRVENIGVDRIDRALKILTQMNYSGYSCGKLAKLSGLSQINISRMVRGEAIAPRYTTVDALERMFKKEGYMDKDL